MKYRIADNTTNKLHFAETEKQKNEMLRDLVGHDLEVATYDTHKRVVYAVINKYGSSHVHDEIREEKEIDQWMEDNKKNFGKYNEHGIKTIILIEPYHTIENESRISRIKID